MIRDKIKNRAALTAIAVKLRRQGKKIVFTNGCFDIIHYGHVHYLEQAKTRGDVLIVALNSDASVRRLKGPSRPIVRQKQRAGVIAGLESVDYVTVFNEETPLKLIQKIKPHVLVKGSDWSNGTIVGSDVVRNSGGKVVRAVFHKGCSTTALIEKIVKQNRGK